MRYIKTTKAIVEVDQTVTLKQMDVPTSARNVKNFCDVYMRLSELIDGVNPANFSTNNQGAGTDMFDFAFEVAGLAKQLMEIANTNAHEYVHGLMMADQTGSQIPQGDAVFELGRKHGLEVVGVDDEGEV